MALQVEGIIFIFDFGVKCPFFKVCFLMFQDYQHVELFSCGG